MNGQLALILHGHLPFVRHPEHERPLEEDWLHEAVAECYLPLLWVLEGWSRDALPAKISLTLTPTLCSMLGDPLLRERTHRYLLGRQALAEREVERAALEPERAAVATFYLERFTRLLKDWEGCGGGLLARFAALQRSGHLELLTCAATHGILPLIAAHPPSLRGQIATAVEQHHSWFGRKPSGIWLPECAYSPAVEPALAEAGLRWFVLDSHGVTHAKPQPLFSTFAPVVTPAGLAAFGRDMESSMQVWSRDVGYPGDPRYRDFHSDIAFDLELDYIHPHLPAPPHRTFTGLKYHRVGAKDGSKELYRRAGALEAAKTHAAHFVGQRRAQLASAAALMGREPIVVAPYDAELFGHWWFEGPEFLDELIRQGCAAGLAFTTPGAFLAQHPTHQQAAPSPSSWGEGGHLKVWMNHGNHWIWNHLVVAMERMTALVESLPNPTALECRALRQAARELLLAQASDWPFMLKCGASPEYAADRVRVHLLRFIALHEQLSSTAVDAAWLEGIEGVDNLFPEVNPDHWRHRPALAPTA